MEEGDRLPSFPVMERPDVVAILRVVELEHCAYAKSLPAEPTARAFGAARQRIQADDGRQAELPADLLFIEFPIILHTTDDQQQQCRKAAVKQMFHVGIY